MLTSNALLFFMFACRIILNCLLIIANETKNDEHRYIAVTTLTDVNECEANPSTSFGPCVNAGSCTNTPGGFICTCLDGWDGATCAQDIHDCVGQCKNGATCIDLNNDYHCVCANGYTGLLKYNSILFDGLYVRYFSASAIDFSKSFRISFFGCGPFISYLLLALHFLAR